MYSCSRQWWNLFSLFYYFFSLIFHIHTDILVFIFSCSPLFLRSDELRQKFPLLGWGRRGMNLSIWKHPTFFLSLWILFTLTVILPHYCYAYFFILSSSQHKISIFVLFLGGGGVLIVCLLVFLPRQQVIFNKLFSEQVCVHDNS